MVEVLWGVSRVLRCSDLVAVLPWAAPACRRRGGQQGQEGLPLVDLPLVDLPLVGLPLVGLPLAGLPLVDRVRR